MIRVLLPERLILPSLHSVLVSRVDVSTRAVRVRQAPQTTPWGTRGASRRRPARIPGFPPAVEVYAAKATRLNHLAGCEVRGELGVVLEREVTRLGVANALGEISDGANGNLGSTGRGRADAQVRGCAAAPATAVPSSSAANAASNSFMVVLVAHLRARASAPPRGRGGRRGCPGGGCECLSPSAGHLLRRVSHAERSLRSALVCVLRARRLVLRERASVARLAFFACG